MLESDEFTYLRLATIERLKEDWALAETVEEREEAHAQLRGLRTLLTTANRVISDGEVEAHQRENRTTV